MRTIFIVCISALVIGVSASFIELSKTKDRLVEITWQKNLEGDFSFNEKWSYPLGVYKNRWGQVSCDGFCPIETDAMRDSVGRLYENSLTSFYSLVDTTHLQHSLLAVGSMYEWTGSDHINFKKQEDGSVIGSSTCNASNHTSLHIKMEDDKIKAWLDFVGIRDVKRHIFPLKDGWIKMDKKLFSEGIVKASFHFDFINTIDASVPLNCEGKIYSEIH
jgi:hypothetical protein